MSVRRLLGYATMSIFRSWESGAALTTSLVLMAVLTLLGTAAIVTGIIDTKIGGNYKTSVQAFYAAEAGLEEARARLRATTETDPYIADLSGNPQWKAYIASGTKPREITPAKPRQTALQRAQALGYDATHHSFSYSEQSALDYTVIIEPITGSPSQLRITSFGSMGSSENVQQIVVTKPPPFTVPAAFYVKTQTQIQGGFTNIDGMDGCGKEENKPGVLTPRTPQSPWALGGVTIVMDTVRQMGSPNIDGTSKIVYDSTDLDIQTLVTRFQAYANFAYTVSDATHTTTTTPGPGDNWGQPVLGATPRQPSICNVYNVVHYDTGGSSIELADGVTGCGILLVAGNLKLHRGFSWYGLILVTGTIVASSEQGTTQITGAVLSGSTSSQNTLSSASNIVYCSSAVNTQNLPLRVRSWREIY